MCLPGASLKLQPGAPDLQRGRRPVIHRDGCRCPGAVGALPTPPVAARFQPSLFDAELIGGPLVLLVTVAPTEGERYPVSAH
jgi:hypothetical protein